MIPHENCGHALAHQLKRIPAGSDGETMGPVNFADEELGQCGVLEQALHIPIAGTPVASPLNGKLQVDAMVAFSTYSLQKPEGGVGRPSQVADCNL